MSLVDSTLGKWSDESCKKSALITCQKKQEFNLNLVKSLMEKQEKIIEKQQAQIDSIIPMGFLYTQLPNQSSPQQLWPNMKWSDVSTQYAGLFFRTVGASAEPFGTVQQANQVPNKSILFFLLSKRNGRKTFSSKTGNLDFILSHSFVGRLILAKDFSINIVVLNPK